MANVVAASTSHDARCVVVEIGFTGCSFRDAVPRGPAPGASGQPLAPRARLAARPSIRRSVITVLLLQSCPSNETAAVRAIGLPPADQTISVAINGRWSRPL